MHALNPPKVLLPVQAFLLALALLSCGSPDYAPVPYSSNSAPVARLSWVSGQTLGLEVLLDASDSYDAEGHALSYHWDFGAAPSGSELDASAFLPNDSRSAGQTRFVPDFMGPWTISLRVEDELGRFSESSWLILEVGAAGLEPVADAGVDTYAIEGDLVCFDGSASSDPMGQDLSFRWELVVRPDLSSLDGADGVGFDGPEACITPDAPGGFMLSLIVDNGLQWSDPDYVLVTVGSTNQAPVSDITIQTAASCDTVVLDGSGSSDADGDALSYSWHVLLVPTGSQVPTGTDAFEDPNEPVASFYADIPGDYYVQLVVGDGKTWSEPLLEMLSLEPKEANEAPIALHSSDVVLVDTPAMGCSHACPTWQLSLDAVASYDPDGDPIRVSWELLSGEAELSSTEGLEVSLQIAGPPGDCGGQTQSNVVEVAVTVTDCSGDEDTSQITAVYHCGLL